METILLVDDEPTVLSFCETILKRGSYSVHSASSGNQALQLIEAGGIQVDLALIDVMMPGMNGIELAKRIHTTRPGVKIILMTGFTPREILPIIGNNPFRVVWKPFKTESLLRMIENSLGESTATNA